MGRVIVGLLEGLLVGLQDISVRKRVRAVLNRLKGSKGFGVGPFLPTATGRVYGLRKVKLGLKGVGLGCSSKSKRATRLKPSDWVRPLAMENSLLAVGLVLPSQLASEVRLGALVVELSVLERVLGESPPHAGELEFSTLPAFEGCLGASDVWRPAGDGSSLGAMPIPPVSSLAVTVVAFPLGKDREGCLGSLDDESSSGVALLKEPEPTPSVSPQASSVVDFPLKEAQAESGRNFAPAMGLLRRGFLGPRSPSPASSSLGCKVATVKDKGISALVNGLIHRGFLGSNFDSSMIPVVSKVCSSPLAAPISSVSKSQLAYSQRVKD